MKIHPSQRKFTNTTIPHHLACSYPKYVFKKNVIYLILTAIYVYTHSHTNIARYTIPHYFTYRWHINHSNHTEKKGDKAQLRPTPSLSKIHPTIRATGVIRPHPTPNDTHTHMKNRQEIQSGTGDCEKGGSSSTRPAVIWTWRHNKIQMALVGKNPTPTRQLRIEPDSINFQSQSNRN